MANITLSLLGTATVSMEQYATINSDFGTNIRFSSSCIYPIAFGTVYNNPTSNISNTGIYGSYCYYMNSTIGIKPRRINATDSSGSNITGTWPVWDGSQANTNAFYGAAGFNWSNTGPTVDIGSFSWGFTSPSNNGTSTVEPTWNATSLPVNLSAGSLGYYPHVPPAFIWANQCIDNRGSLGVMTQWGSSIASFSGNNIFAGYASQDGTVLSYDQSHPLVAGTLDLNTSQVGEIYTANWFDINAASNTNYWMTPYRQVGGSDTNNPLIRVTYTIGSTGINVSSTDFINFDDATINANIGDQNGSWCLKPVPAGFLMTYYASGTRTVVFIPSTFSGYYKFTMQALDGYSTNALESSYFTIASDADGYLFGAYSGEGQIGVMGNPPFAPPSPIPLLVPPGPSPPTPGGGGSLPTPIPIYPNGPSGYPVSVHQFCHSCGVNGMRLAQGF